MDMVNALSTQIENNVPQAIFDQAVKMDLVNNALAGVVEQVAREFANQALASNPLAEQAGGLLGKVADLFGGGNAVGSSMGNLMMEALNHTDLDEKLRAAVTEGFSRYLHEHGSQLADVAMRGVKTALSD